MNNVVAILSKERAASAERIDALSGELRDLRVRVREIDDAIALLSGQTPPLRTPRSSGGDLKSLILTLLRSHGSEGATAKDLASSLTASGRETSEASVSSTLSRMKNEDGQCENKLGKWYAKNAEGPDTSAPEPSQDSGAGDGSRGAPSQPTAAGSIPAASTFVRPRPVAFDDDLDEVPF